MARISKKRLAQIREKYKNVSEAIDIKRAMGARQYSRKRSEIAQVKKQLRVLSAQSEQRQQTIFQLQGLRLDARPVIRDKMRLDQEARDLKQTKYQLEFDIRSGAGYITTAEDVKIAIDNSDLTEEQEAVLNALQDKVEDYRVGDRTIDRFYHVYQFDSINKDTLRLFAKGEGLI